MFRWCVRTAPAAPPYPVLTHRGDVSHGLGFEGVGQQHEFVYSLFRIHYFLYSINSINYKLIYYDLLNYCSRCAFHIFVLGARPLGAFLVDVSSVHDWCNKHVLTIADLGRSNLWLLPVIAQCEANKSFVLDQLALLFSVSFTRDFLRLFFRCLVSGSLNPQRFSFARLINYMLLRIATNYW